MSIEITSIEKSKIVAKNGLYFSVAERLGPHKFRCDAVQSGRGRWHKIRPWITLETSLTI